MNFCPNCGEKVPDHNPPEREGLCEYCWQSERSRSCAACGQRITPDVRDEYEGYCAECWSVKPQIKFNGND